MQISKIVLAKMSDQVCTKDFVQHKTKRRHAELDFLAYACRRPLPGVPAALPCGRHYVYIYRILHSLLVHATLANWSHTRIRNRSSSEKKTKNSPRAEETLVQNLVIARALAALVHDRVTRFSTSVSCTR